MVKGKAKSKNPFVDKKNCTIYRIVHNQVADVAEGTAVPGTLQMVHGETDYFPEETAKLEEAYREELRQKARLAQQAAGFVPGMEGWEDEEYEEYEEGDGDEDWDEDGWDDEEGMMRKDRSEMTQLERDIDELGLPEDGYDYSAHLRNPGQGLFLQAHVSAQMAEVIENRERMKKKTMSKAEKEIFELLENDDDGTAASEEEEEEEEEEEDDDAPPALEEGEGEGGASAAAKKEKKEKKQKKAPHTGNKILVEGDLPDDILGFLNGNGDDYDDAMSASQYADWVPPAERLVDEQFEVMMHKYGDDAIGELDDEHPGLVPQGGTEASYYALLDQYIAMGKQPATKPEFMEGKNQMIEADEYFEMIKEDEEEEAKLVDATRRLIIKMDKEAETFQGDYEEVEVEEREEWDCESILSTYSNIYNRPTIIHDGKDRRIKLHPVTGVPIVGGDDEKKKPGMGTVGEDEEEEEEEEEGGPIMIAKRTRGETPEEKKARKELAKQVKAAALEKKKAKALAAGAAKGRPVVGGGDPRTRPGLSVTRYVA